MNEKDIEFFLTTERKADMILAEISRLKEDLQDFNSRMDSCLIIRRKAFDEYPNKKTLMLLNQRIKNMTRRPLED